MTQTKFAKQVKSATFISGISVAVYTGLALMVVAIYITEFFEVVAKFIGDYISRD